MAGGHARGVVMDDLQVNDRVRLREDYLDLQRGPWVSCSASTAGSDRTSVVKFERGVREVPVNRPEPLVLDSSTATQATVACLREATSRHHPVRPEDRELELGIFDSADDHPEIETEPLFPGEPLAAFVSPDHPLAEREVVTPDDVRSEALIVLHRELNPGLYDRVLTSIEAAGYHFRKSVKSTAPPLETSRSESRGARGSCSPRCRSRS